MTAAKKSITTKKAPAKKTGSEEIFSFNKIESTDF